MLRMMSASSVPIRSTHSWALVFAGGLVAATLDLLYACVFWRVKSDVPAERIFQSVAAGLLGEASFQGGTATAGLGVALHYLIAVSMSVVYYVAARRWALLGQRPLLYGAGYGLLLYMIMNYIVVPLSAAGPASKDPLWITLSIAAHVLLIGIPISLFVRRALAYEG